MFIVSNRLLKFDRCLKSTINKGFKSFKNFIPYANIWNTGVSSQYFSTKINEIQTEFEVIDNEEVEDSKDNDPKNVNEIDKEECSFIENEQNPNLLIVQTRYGIFRILNTYMVPQKLKETKTIYYLNDQISINFIRKILKEDQKSLLIFKPDSHFSNMMSLFLGYKRSIARTNYGTQKKPQNPFKKCKTPSEIFNLSRRIKLNEKSLLARIYVIGNYDGTLRIKGESAVSGLLKSTIEDSQRFENNKLGYFKYEYLLPIPYWQGLHSADEYEKEGISIKSLDSKKIYPHHGVWSPTSQHYLSVLEKYIEENRNSLKHKKNILDVGCGTGILSFLLSVKCELKSIYGIDLNPKAIECTRLNSQLLDLQSNIKAEKMDIVDCIKRNKTDVELERLR